MTPDDLDQQVAAALDAEPSPASLARLEQFWRAQSRAQHVRRIRRRVAALAAAILLVAFTAWLTFARTKPSSTPNNESIVEVPSPIQNPKPKIQNPQPSPAPTPAPTHVRPPTDYERLIFAARTAAPVDPEQILLNRLRRAASPEQTRKIVANLATVGTQRSVPALLDSARQPAAQTEAIAALEHILGVQRLAQLVPQSNSAAVRVALLSRLLAAESDVALAAFLALAGDRATRADALAAAAAADHLPLDRLIAALDASQKPLRLAAAIVLSHIDDAAITEALIARVSQDDRASVEAWLALITRRDEAIDKFLDQVVSKPKLLAQLNNAQAYYARLTP